MKPLIVIPTYNEKDNIPVLIENILALPVSVSILFIDDNSPDGSAALIKEYCTRYPQRIMLMERPQKLGLGSAYITGFKYALEYDFDPILQMDADLSHDPSVIPAFLKEIEQIDMICGSRYLNGVSVVNWPLWRLILSYGANRYARLITGLKLTDITTGFTCIRKQVLERIPLTKLQSEGYSFQIELKFFAHRYGFTLKEIPIIFVDRRFGHSKLSRNIIREAITLVLRLRFGFRREK